jgi:hypothetical protein
MTWMKKKLFEAVAAMVLCVSALRAVARPTPGLFARARRAVELVSVYGLARPLRVAAVGRRKSRRARSRTHNARHGAFLQVEPKPTHANVAILRGGEGERKRLEPIRSAEANQSAQRQDGGA